MSTDPRRVLYDPASRASFHHLLAATMRGIAADEKSPTFKSGALRYAEAFEASAYAALPIAR